MTIYSKIRLFFIITFLVVFSVSCNKKNDVIPDVYIDFRVDITDTRFIALQSPGGSIYIDGRTNNDGSLAAGYTGSGIIVTRGTIEYEFFAYDRTCPYEYTATGDAIKINIDASLFARAVCPECKTTYELISFGQKVSGPGQYPLKNYKTSFDGRWIRVWNN